MSTQECNYYFDEAHPLMPYTHTAYAMPNTYPPDGATRIKPPRNKDGTYPANKHPGYKNGKWAHIDDFRGRQGYVNGKPHTINDFGPLPGGWSDTPPEPTADELMQRLRSARDWRLAASDKYLLADYPISQEQLVGVEAYRTALRALPAQPGAPWDGGGELTPWPEHPTV